MKTKMNKLYALLIFVLAASPLYSLQTNEGNNLVLVGTKIAKTETVIPTPETWVPPAVGWVFEFPTTSKKLKQGDYVEVQRVWSDATTSRHSFRVSGFSNTGAYLIEETYAKNAGILRLIFLNMSKKEMIYEEINIFSRDEDWLAKTVYKAKFLDPGDSLSLPPRKIHQQ